MTAETIETTVERVDEQLRAVVHGSREGVHRIAAARRWRLALVVWALGPEIAADAPDVARLLALHKFLSPEAS
jgi:hypothetical protein